MLGNKAVSSPQHSPGRKGRNLPAPKRPFVEWKTENSWTLHLPTAADRRGQWLSRWSQASCHPPLLPWKGKDVEQWVTGGLSGANCNICITQIAACSSLSPRMVCTGFDKELPWWLLFVLFCFVGFGFFGLESVCVCLGFICVRAKPPDLSPPPACSP